MSKSNKHAVLMVAIAMSEEMGYTHVTRDGIAHRAGVAMGTVNNYLGTMRQVRRAIVRHALRTNNLTIIAQAVVNKDPLAKKISIEVKR